MTDPQESQSSHPQTTCHHYLFRGSWRQNPDASSLLACKLPQATISQRTIRTDTDKGWATTQPALVEPDIAPNTTSSSADFSIHTAISYTTSPSPHICYDPGTGPTKFFYPPATPPSVTITLPATQPIPPSAPVIPSLFTTAIPEILITWPTSHT